MKPFLGLLLCCVLALFSSRRVDVWQSEEALWQEAVRQSPEMPRTHMNLGSVYEQRHRYQDAMDQYQETMRWSWTANRMQKHQRMSRAMAESNIALLLLTRSDFKGAIEMATAALNTYPIRGALLNRGTAYLALHRCDDMIIDYLQAGIWDLPRCQK